MSVDESSVSPLRVGVVGLGYAGRAHLERYLELPEVKVIGLSDVDAERLSSVGQTHGVPHLYPDRSEEHTSELQSLFATSYAVFCLKKKKK